MGEHWAARGRSASRINFSHIYTEILEGLTINIMENHFSLQMIKSWRRFRMRAVCRLWVGLARLFIFHEPRKDLRLPLIVMVIFPFSL